MINDFAPHSNPDTLPLGPALAMVDIRSLSLWYGGSQALKDISLTIPRNMVTAFIGPSGCGKSTLLRCLNRMNDLAENVSIRGAITVNHHDIYGAAEDVDGLRKRIGMVFQRSTPFPKTIYVNVAFGPRITGIKLRSELDRIVEESLAGAALWDEVKDRLRDSALGLSGGQQQRLCIARAIAIEPDVLLHDEPASALDPISTGAIEELMHSLKHRYTMLIVTHNMQQAARVADYTAFFSLDRVDRVGTLIEYDDTDTIFRKPADTRTRDYVTGQFG